MLRIYQFSSSTLHRPSQPQPERLETTSQPSSLQKLHDKIPNHVLQLRHLPRLSVCLGRPTLGHATQGLGFGLQGCLRGVSGLHAPRPWAFGIWGFWTKLIEAVLGWPYWCWGSVAQVTGIPCRVT